MKKSVKIIFLEKINNARTRENLYHAFLKEIYYEKILSDRRRKEDVSSVMMDGFYV